MRRVVYHTLSLNNRHFETQKKEYLRTWMLKIDTYIQKIYPGILEAENHSDNMHRI